MSKVIEPSTPTLNEERMPNLNLQTTKDSFTEEMEVVKKVNDLFDFTTKEGRKERKIYFKYVERLLENQRKNEQADALLNNSAFIWGLENQLFSERRLDDAEDIEEGAAITPKKGSLLDRLMAVEAAVKFKFESLAEQLRDINELNLSIGKDLNDLSKGLKKKKKYRTTKLNHWTCPVLQYTKDGEFIRKWDNLHVINDTTSFNGNAIAENLKEATKSSQGYVWVAVM